jgi:hypothetical protein
VRVERRGEERGEREKKRRKERGDRTMSRRKERNERKGRRWSFPLEDPKNVCFPPIFI